MNDKILLKILQKAISIQGPAVLKSPNELLNIWEDLLPEMKKEREAFAKSYNREFGEVLYDLYQANFRAKTEALEQTKQYMKEEAALIEAWRKQLMGLTDRELSQRTVEVKRFQDYIPALQQLRKKYGKNLSEDMVRSFVEENNLFVRFSLMVDDVMKDLEDLSRY